MESQKIGNVSRNNLEVVTIYEHVRESIREKRWHFPTLGDSPEPPWYIHMGPRSILVPRAFLDCVVEMLREEGFICRNEYYVGYAAGPFWAVVIEQMPDLTK